MEKTTEKFDSWTYYTQRQGSEYVFEDYLRGKVRQFGGDNGSEFVEYARKDNELYGSYKEFYNKTKTLKKIGRYYYNKFSIGIWKLYNEDGYLIETIDKDIPYKNYPWEKVERFITEELKLNLFDKDVEVEYIKEQMSPKALANLETESKEEKDDSKYVDEKVTKVEGKNGEKEVTYNVVREKGKEVSREVASEKVITEATAKVVVVGTKQRPAAQQQEVAAAQQSYAAPAQSYSAPGGSVVLSNGNTAGADGAAAAQEMARRTGVPASTWEHIIARESNGQVGARNASGASGLFQTMPGWGSTATVQDQIDAATRAYQAQGLSAWGM